MYIARIGLSEACRRRYDGSSEIYKNCSYLNPDKLKKPSGFFDSCLDLSNPKLNPPGMNGLPGLPAAPSAAGEGAPPGMAAGDEGPGLAAEGDGEYLAAAE